ncbi:hypothetical protein KR032_006604 [Drosophila birchii]|nr:hypothetical protein KR032_006604 [Drosophila birchii]
MDSVKSFFASSTKDGNLTNSSRQSSVAGNAASSRWGRSWSTSSQHTDPEPGSGSNSGASKSGNPCDVKRKDSDNYFYIM